MFENKPLKKEPKHQKGAWVINFVARNLGSGTQVPKLQGCP